MGSALVDFFAANNNSRIVSVSRSNSPATNSDIHYNVAELGWDAIIEALISYKDWIIIDLAYASVPNTSFADPIKDFSDNLYMVNKHLDSIAKLNVKKYIYISSGGTIYGQTDKPMISESEQNFPLSPYGITKMACERYVHLYNITHGLPTCIVRPSNIYGPGQKPFRGQGFVSTALGLAYKNEPVKVFGDGNHVRDYLYIDDFCDAIDAVIKTGENGAIYNVGSEIGLSINDVIEAINELLHAEGGELKREYLEARPFDVKNNVLDSKKLREISGWKPTTNFKDGLNTTNQWIKQYLKQHL